MPLPTERTVTGTYTNPVTGDPYDGTTGDHFVIFEPVPERWTDQGGNQILVGGGQVNLDATGQFSEALVCTDAADVLPEEDRLWRLREHVDGEWNTWYFSLPEGDGTPIDISDILSVDIEGIVYVPVPGPEGPPGTPGEDGNIQTVNGQEGPDVVLDAADVGADPAGSADAAEAAAITAAEDLAAQKLDLAGGTMTGTINSTLPTADTVADATLVGADVFDRFRRYADGAMEWGPGDGDRDVRLERFAADVLALLGADFRIGETGVKGYRFRQSGASLDVEGAGADLFLSVFENGDFTGDQFQYLRLENGAQLAHASGKWIFVDGPSGGAVHTLDGFANQLGFHGAAPVDQQAVTGAQGDGTALASLLSALDTVGLIQDTTTAGSGVTIADLTATTPFSIAHRGSGSEYPEHTMVAYESAVAAGAKAIEVSVMLTADGIPVCFHDVDLERMTGVVGESVGDYTYAMLREVVKVKAQDLLGDGWSDQPMPTLRDVLDRFMGKVVIFLEGKDNPSIPVIQQMLLADYPNAQESVVWKNYYLATSFPWAKNNGFTTWAYIDAGTTSGQMDAVDANVDWWGVPLAAADSKITEVVNRGKTTIVWPIHRHAEVDRVVGLGVDGLMTSEWTYINNQPEFTEDQFWTRVKAPGTIGVSESDPDYALKYDENGRAFIEQIPNNAVLMGGHRVSVAQAADNYTIGYTMTWDTIPGTNLHSGIAFAKPDDEQYVFSGANSTGGYHVVLRNNGTLQLYRHDAGVTTGVQLATAGTETPVAGVPMTFEVEVTATDITVTRTDVGPYSINSSDTTYRGRYWHLSPGSVTDLNTTPYFEDISIF